MKRLSLIFLLFFLLSGCGAEKAPVAEAPVTEAPASQSPEGSFTLTFITVGKGDAFLLTTPENRHYLIDTGKAQDFPQIGRTLRVKGIRTLDGIFLTHGHKDHAGCLDILLQCFPTEAVYYSGSDSFSYHEILPWDCAEKRGSRAAALKGGEILDLGGVTAEVFIPPVPDPENENNNSLILKLTHGDCSCLMMGDAELQEERQLMDSRMDLQADILKLGHHGEDDATSPAFLDLVKPSIGLVAGNEEENPQSMDPMIADLLKSRDIRCWYSECSGLALEFTSDGNTFTQSVLADRELPGSLSLSISRADRKNQRITIRNQGEDTADLSGCLLYSLRRDEVFRFPDGTSLEPGGELTVACLDADEPGDLTWEQESVWQKKRDDALLFDENLNLLDLSPAGSSGS